MFSFAPPVKLVHARINQERHVVERVFFEHYMNHSVLDCHLLCRDSELLKASPDDSPHIFFVKDYKVFRVLHHMAVLAQKLHRETVESADVACAYACHFMNPLLHLLCGFVRERQAQNPAR
jgi:hypothetical protein